MNYTVILVMASIMFSSLSLGTILIFLKIFMRLYSLGEKQYITILQGISLIFIGVFLEALHMAVILADIYGILIPKLYIPKDLPYAQRYSFLWFPSSFLYFLGYLIIFVFCIRQYKKQVVPTFSIIIFLTFLPQIFHVASFIVLIGFLFAIRVKSNVNRQYSLLLIFFMLASSHILQVVSFNTMPMLLYAISVFLRMLAFVEILFIIRVGGHEKEI